MSERRRRIIMTGGGTAGHVMPNIALLPELMSKKLRNSIYRFRRRH